MGKQYESVSAVVENLTDDKEFHDEFDREIGDKALAKALFAMRCSKGVSQEQMASKLGCTQSRISKLENSGVGGIRVGDLVAYARVLGLSASICFHERRSSGKLPTEQIQQGPILEVCAPTEAPAAATATARAPSALRS